MKKSITYRLMHFALIVAALATSLSAFALPTPEKLYLMWDGNGWPQPTKDNAAQFPELTKVSDGVFEIEVTNPWGNSYAAQRLNFAFISELSDSYDNGMCYCRYRLVPVYDNIYGMNEIGRSNIRCLPFTYSAYDPNTEAFSGFYKNKAKLRVDFNEGKVYCISDLSEVIVFDDQPTPTLATADQYCALEKQHTYYKPAGDVKWRIYDFLEGKMFGGDTSAYSTTAYFNKGFEDDPAFEIRNWDGGVLKFNGNFVQLNSINKDKLSASELENSYIVGDFCDWNVTEGVKLQRIGVSTFMATIPVGTQEFKVTTDGWNYNFGADYAYGVRKGPDGAFYIHPEMNGSNFRFDLPTFEEHILTIDLRKNMVIFGFNAPLTAVGNYDPTGTPVLEEEGVYLNIPSDNCVEFTSENLPIINLAAQKFTAQEDGTYYLSTRIPDGDFEFNIVTKLGADQSATKVVCPADDGVLNTSQPRVHVPAKEATFNEAGKWVWQNWEYAKGLVDLIYNPVSNELTINIPSMISPSSEALPEVIYLVGAPQDWDVSSDAMPLHYMSSGVYYGEFNVAEGENQLRFYTELGNWGNDAGYPSIGSGPDDFDYVYVYLSDTAQEMSCTPGKGNWNVISYNGRLCVSVDLKNNKVVFSDMPLDCGTPATPPVAKNMYVCNGSGYYPLYDNSQNNVLYREIGGSEIYLFNRIPEYKREDPRWLESALSVAPSGRDLEAHGLTAYEIVESGDKVIKSNDGIAVIYVQDNTVYITSYNNHFGRIKYITVGEEEKPTFANLEEFKDRIVLNHTLLSPLSLPAGNHTLYLKNPAYTDYVVECDVDFQENDYVRYYDYYIGDFSQLNIKNWTGGRLGIIKETSFFNVDAIDNVAYKVYEKGGEYEVSVPETAPGSRVFEGELSVNDFGVIVARLYSKIGDLENIYWGAPVADSAGLDAAPEKYTLYKSKGLFENKFPVAPGHYFYRLPEVVSGSVKVRLDLNDMTMSFSPVDANVKEAVKIAVAGSEGYSEASNMAAPSTVDDDVNVFNFGQLPPQDFTLKIGNYADEKALRRYNRAAPARMSFNEFGIGEMQYDPTQNNEININMSRRGNLNVAIDTKENKIKVFNEAAFDGYFVIDAGDEYSQNFENFNSENAKVVFEGAEKQSDAITFTEEKTSVILGSSLPSNREFNASEYIIPLNSYEAVIDLAELDEERQIEVTAVKSAIMYGGLDLRNSKDKNIKLTYDDENNKLIIFSADESGVDNIEVDGTRVAVVEGGVLVKAAEADVFRAYTLQGVCVANVTLKGGESMFVPLQAGFYVTNFGKVIVK